MNDVQLKMTEDGSHTLFSVRVGECYHSEHGAIQESEHIFIDSGWKHCHKSEPHVLEIGFGTGLNAFLTLLQAEKDQKKTVYTALELYPLEKDRIENLNYSQLLGLSKKELFDQLHLVDWNCRVPVTSWFELEKLQADFTKVELSGVYDLIYFDAFSPDKQPEMWTPERFEYLFQHAAQAAVLTTYCAKGVVRRALQAAGFQVERLPGPPGKREILRATKV